MPLAHTVHRFGSPADSEGAVGLGGRAVRLEVEEIVPEEITSVVSENWCL